MKSAHRRPAARLAAGVLLLAGCTPQAAPPPSASPTASSTTTTTSSSAPPRSFTSAAGGDILIHPPVDRAGRRRRRRYAQLRPVAGRRSIRDQHRRVDLPPGDTACRARRAVPRLPGVQRAARGCEGTGRRGVRQLFDGVQPHARPRRGRHRQHVGCDGRGRSGAHRLSPHAGGGGQAAAASVDDEPTRPAAGDRRRASGSCRRSGSWTSPPCPKRHAVQRTDREVLGPGAAGQGLTRVHR
jgi:hypothetical protein